MPTKKISQQDFEQIERDQNYHVNNQYLIRTYFGFPTPAENVKHYVENATGEAAQKERSTEIKKLVGQILINEGSITALKAAIQKIEPYFEGQKTGASGQAKRIFRNFQYQNDLML